MPVDRSPTAADGKRSFELSRLYALARAALDARERRVSLGNGLYRGDVAAEMRLAVRLEQVREWLAEVEAESARAGAGNGSKG